MSRANKKSLRSDLLPSVSPFAHHWNCSECGNSVLAGSGSFNSTGGMNVARIEHTVALLANGQVLVAGGSTPFSTNAEP